MAKLEGHAAVSTELNHEFSYHVGGYKSPYAVIRQITLPVDEAGAMQIARDTAITIHIKADINSWFGYHAPVKIADNSAFHSPGNWLCGWLIIMKVYLLLKILNNAY